MVDTTSSRKVFEPGTIDRRIVLCDDSVDLFGWKDVIKVSDVSQGPGWWLASDGKWYAPELAPGSQTPETPPTGTQATKPTWSSKFPHVDADSVKKGAHVALGALEGSGLTKVDRKTGEVKVKKLGVAKAALRPAKTFRKAINGATADFVKETPERDPNS